MIEGSDPRVLEWLIAAGIPVDGLTRVVIEITPALVRVETKYHLAEDTAEPMFGQTGREFAASLKADRDREKEGSGI